MAEPSVSAVILTKNSEKTVGKTLDSLMRYSPTYVEEIVVVDGGSRDRTLEVVGRYPCRVIVERGLGVAGARNLGWRAASGELILFVDSDVVLGRGFFPKVLGFIERGWDGVGSAYKAIVSGWLSKTIGEIWRFKFARLRKVESPLVGSSCLLVKRKVLSDLGGFHLIHMYGAEDLCFSWRAYRAGYRIGWWFNAPVYHHPRGSLADYLRQQLLWGTYARPFYEEVQREGDAHLLRSRGEYKAIFPLVALRLARANRNPLHLVVFPLGQIMWAAGFLLGGRGA